jgi:tetratricopeptide (TPR) repeat protein
MHTPEFFLLDPSAHWMYLCALLPAWLLRLQTTARGGAAPASAETWVYQGYALDDRRRWQRGIDQLQALHRAEPGRADILYQLSLAEYGLIGLDQAQANKSDLLGRLDQLEVHLEHLAEMDHRPAAVQALRGGALGLRLSEQPLKALILGTQSRKQIEAAVKRDPQDPAAWVELGNLRYHAPLPFGGDTRDAIRCYQQALDLFDQQPQRRRHNWLYLHALAWLGRSHARLDHHEKARQAYQRALDFEPDFRWVKVDLLPAVQG